MSDHAEHARNLRTLVETRYAALIEACREARVVFHDDAGVAERVQAVLAASDFAFDTLRREPELLGARLAAWVTDPGHAGARQAQLGTRADDADFAARLRRFRRRESLRLVWRDVTGLDAVEATLAGATELAEVCLDAALAAAEASLAQRFGVPRNAQGERQTLVVLGMGKLGGGELNFSSDIDLILAFGEPGQCDGTRGIDNEDYFTRLGQRMSQLLAEVSAEGFVFRVDLRLRPFGTAGRLALPFAAMEQYYQREGRDWERYAWIKARPVAGDRAGGTRLLAQLQPFVYRRYLDYGAIDGLREMKALIDAEVSRRELCDHIKLGPGGIRELEFLVQLAQLIRGGREPGLRTPNLMAALTACARLGYIAPQLAQRLRDAYRFLRRVENRLQMLRDEQTHTLPGDDFTRYRLAQTLGYVDWAALLAELDRQRAVVAEEFAAVLSAPRRRARPEADEQRLNVLWRALVQGVPEQGAQDQPADAPAYYEALLQFATSPGVRGLGARARERLERVLPNLLASAGRAPEAALAAQRVLALCNAIVRRPTYLALLDERASARERVVDVLARSTLLAERVCAHPLLLDDLLATHADTGLPEPGELTETLARRLSAHPGHDAEEVLEQLAEIRESLAFRIGVAQLDRRHRADAIAQALADLAQATLTRVLALALDDTRQQYGPLPGVADDAGIVVLGYGSLGGAELGFASDLDLVFLYDGAHGTRMSTGTRAVEGSRWFARVAQRVVHWLGASTRAGRLYEVDVRLRPDGAKGLLVSSLEAFSDYQHDRAWLWEHQALVRARAVAGDAALAARFAQVRASVLGRAREPVALAADVARMRERWRQELDRSNALRFDLKQGPGGLTDLEFLLQSLVLRHAATHPALLATTRTSTLLESLVVAGLLQADDGARLAAAHDALLSRALDRTLDAVPRVVPRDAALTLHTDAVQRAAQAHGLLSDP